MLKESKGKLPLDHSSSEVRPDSGKTVSEGSQTVHLVKRAFIRAADTTRGWVVPPWDWRAEGTDPCSVGK